MATAKRVGKSGRTIYIYKADESKTLDALRHEFIDYTLTSELKSPSQKLINKLIALFEEIIYERKEKLIDKVLGVI